MSMHHSANPQKEAFCHAVGEVLDRGYSITGAELNALGVSYGYSESAAGLMLWDIGVRESLAFRGIALAIEKYKGRSIYYDENAEHVSKGISASEQQIDAAYRNARNKRSLDVSE